MSEYVNIKPTKFILVGIMLLAIVLSGYYYNVTKDQTPWWDGLSYLNSGNKLVSGVPENVPQEDLISPRRPFLMPLVYGSIFALGLGETGIRFFQIAVYLLIVYFTYLLGKRLYNEYTGLIAAFLSVIFWQYLFFAQRVLVGMDSTLFFLIAAHFLWKYIDNEQYKHLYIATAFWALSFFAKATAMVLILPLFALLFFKHKFKMFTFKRFIVPILIMVLVMSPFIVWLCMNYDNPIGVFLGTGGDQARFPIESSSQVFDGIWRYVSYFPEYLTWIIFIPFLLGLFLFYKLLIAPDLIFKEKEVQKQGFLALWILTIILFIGITTSASYMEPRYLLYIFPAIFIICAKGFMVVYNFLWEFRKHTAIILVVALLMVAGYSQIRIADKTIKSKAVGYEEIKLASLWIKENTNNDDVIYSQSTPYIIYYGGREVWVNHQHFGVFEMNKTDFISKLRETQTDYLMVSVFELHPDWAYDIGGALELPILFVIPNKVVIYNSSSLLLK